MNELALFAGAGGGILGGHLLGWRTVCAVEYEPYAAAVLIQRQNDGILQPFPVWDDVRTFDGKPWRGRVDVVSGGFPCQDISAAGAGAGITGERSGLWKEMARIICEVRPRYVFVENSPLLTSRGLDVVLGDLAAMGFDAEWGVYGAADAGAPHQRDRIWVLAYTKGFGRESRRPEYARQQGRVGVAQCRSSVPYPTEQGLPHRGGAGVGVPREVKKSERLCGKISDTLRTRCEEQHAPDLAARSGQHPRLLAFDGGETWGAVEPGLGGISHGVACRVVKPWPHEPRDVPRVAKGVPHRVGRIKSIGNGQVPACAVMAWGELWSRISPFAGEGEE